MFYTRLCCFASSCLAGLRRCLTLSTVAAAVALQPFLLVRLSPTDDATACLTRASVLVHPIPVFSIARTLSLLLLVTGAAVLMSVSDGQWPLLTCCPASYMLLAGLNRRPLVHTAATFDRCPLSPSHQLEPLHHPQQVPSTFPVPESRRKHLRRLRCEAQAASSLMI